MYGIGLPVDGLLYEHLLLIRSGDVLGAEYGLPRRPSAIRGIDVIIIPYFIKVAAFQSGLVPQHCGRLLEFQILVQFTDVDVTDAAGHIHLITFKKQPRVIITPFQFLHLPCSFRVVGRKHVTSCVIAIDKQIKLAFVGCQCCGPHPLGV